MRLPKNSVSKPLRRGQMLLNLRSGKKYRVVSSVHKPCLQCEGTGRRWTIKLHTFETDSNFDTTLERLANGLYEIVVPIERPATKTPHIKHGSNKRKRQKKQADAAQRSEAKDKTLRGNVLTVKPSSIGGGRRQRRVPDFGS